MLSGFKHLIHKYKLFLFDYDGVMWVHYNFFNSSIQVIKELQKHNKEIAFLTNNNRKHPNEIHEKFELSELKDTIRKNQIFTSSTITSDYVLIKHPSVKKLFILGTDALASVFREKGFDVIEGSKYDQMYGLTTQEVDEKCLVNPHTQGVVVGYDTKINYFKICYAQRILSNPNTYLFGTNIDSVKRGKNGIMPASNTMIKSVEICSNRTAEIVTKPDPYSFELILNKINTKRKKDGLDLIKKEEVIMIGDNLLTDIKFANNAKIDSLHLLSGVHSMDDINLNKGKKEYGVPTYVLDNLRL